MGLVFLPGQDANGLASWMSKFAAGGVCQPNVSSILGNDLKARFATFSMRVDRMQLLQVPYPDIVIPMASVPSTVPATMVVMAFRAGIYSFPMYVGSADTNLTTGYGFIQTLSLMLSFSSGNLQYLQWYGTTCDGCGGINSAICIRQPGNAKVMSCAVPILNCTCYGLDIPPYACDYNAAIFEQCQTGLNVAWLGTDSQQSPFTTGPQVQRLNSLSIVSLYYFVAGYVQSWYNTTAQSIAGQWTTASGESKKQNIDQNGAFGRRLMTTEPSRAPGLEGLYILDQRDTVMGGQ